MLFRAWRALRPLLPICAFCFLLTIAVSAPRTADAVSTVSPRFDAPAVAVHMPQSISLLLTYFPGNGEAITSATLTVASGAKIEAVTSARGRVRFSSDEINVDYLEDPIGTSVTDTLQLTLMAHAVGLLDWHATLATTLDTESTSLHQPTWSLSVEESLAARWAISPKKWYVGESVEVAIDVMNEDSRSLSGLDIEWSTHVRTDATSEPPWPQPGQSQISYQVTAHVGQSAPATALEISGAAVSERLTHSVLSPQQISILPLPQLHVQGTGLQRDQDGTVTCVWSLDGSRPMRVKDLRFIVDGLTSAAAEGATVDFDAQAGRAQVSIADRELSPGEELSITMRLVPRRSGPLAFRPQVIPYERDEPIQVATVSILPVVDGELVSTDAAARPPTDLELARGGLTESWTSALADLSVPAGSTVRLKAEGRHDANWLVEEAITEALLLRGDRLPLDDEGASYELVFQVASAGAVYEPQRSKLNPFGSRQARNTRVQVNARLIDGERADRQILWARRIESRAEDEVGSDAAALLGGADAVDQAIVPANQRVLEAGLSGLIVGGLFFVFFSP
ncbi:MAG: hypothetical protein CME13_02135 [Gemmatimonadetes bacterium]|nr:hypothetical protein [Gemmatimonadota bacterium]